MTRHFIIVFLLLTSGILSSQITKRDSITEQKEDSLSTKLKTKGIVVEELSYRKPINPLAPSKAAFLSALVPGLGQIYNLSLIHISEPTRPY